MRTPTLAAVAQSGSGYLVYGGALAMFVGLGYLGHSLASPRDRGPLGAALAFFCGPLGLLVAYLIGRPDKGSTAADDRRPCPRCAELIQPAATYCRFCGIEVRPVTASGAIEQVPGPPSDYDLSEWPPSTRVHVRDALKAEKIPHEWIDRTLRANHEWAHRVEAILAAAPNPDSTGR